MVSPMQSDEVLEVNYNATLLDSEISNQEEKKVPEVERESESFH